MAHSIMLRLAYLLTLLAVTSSNKGQTRWSRQISSYTSDISDWVPLSGPVERDPTPLPQIKRQAVAEPRILTDPFPGVRPTGFGQETFPSRTFYNSPANRQLYLQSMPSVPSAPQNYLTDQGFGQSIRFGLSQGNFPLSQGFVAPPFTYENIQQANPRPQAIPSPPVKFESYPKPLPVQQSRPTVNQAPKIKPDSPKFIDGYRAENASLEYAYSQKKKPQSLQKIKFDNTEKPKLETISQVQNTPRTEKEEVQLLYVPIESLNRGQFNFRSPISSPQLINTDLYSQNLPRPNPLKQALTDYQRPVQKPLDTFSEQEYFTEFNTQLKNFDQVPKYSTTPYPTAAPTTPKLKKLKPHQPPLAIFLSQETHKNNQMKVGDVLSSLKTSNTIAVLDSVNPLNAPNVFIGPSNLVPPENYVKFELPYLSNIENSDKKLKQLPFFVAPLSYNTPQGFAKIPFPSPHVGSVVINSQIRETQSTPQVPNVIPNSYSAVPPPSQPQRQVYREPKPATQKPSISFYSTSPPRTFGPTNYQSNYYSFEPQLVSSIEPQKLPETATVPQKSGNYFIGNAPQQYNQQYSKYSQNEFKSQDSGKYNIPKETTTTSTTTPRPTTTRTTTTSQPSTYPSQLLETHNPYSINQAFHFSTPLDYHNYFDDVKEPAATPRAPEFRPSPTLSPATTSTSPQTTEQVAAQKQSYQQQTASPNYLQNYTPEVQYEADDHNSRYPTLNTNDFTTKGEVSSEYSQSLNPSNILTYNVNPTESSDNVDTQQALSQENETETLNAPNVPEVDPSQVYEYNQYETNYNQDDGITSTSTTTTTTTTTSTRRPIRTRGRPRYTTPRSDSNESTSRPIATRRPLRERKPLPTRQRYEPNKITTETPTRKPTEFYESTTKSSRSRTRGRVQFKSSDNEELYDRRVKTHNSKQDDLAYQRDVLHQNYPVTLMERTSTVDIEAITEPVQRISSTRNLEPFTEAYDTENAYTNEKASITQQIPETEIRDDIFIPKYTSRATAQTETPYVPKLPSTRNEEYIYQSRSTAAPTIADNSAYNDAVSEREDSYAAQTTPVPKEDQETNPYATEPASSITEENIPAYSINDELSAFKQEETTTSADIEVTRATTQETNHEIEEEDEENVVQTTPSYNRVRVRPGVIRQYHQASTESSRLKTERRRHPAVTYRPAFDRRRTTMRIEEIEADLKTKQVHSRPEVQDYKHPIYKPDPSTEPSVISSGSQEATTKRGHFRRRRPTYSYTTTSTEASATRRTYETKNRFRGRRPTEKSVEKEDQSTEAPTSTTRNPLHTRYSHRPRLSERYNKKPESEEVEDQDSNYSINRPRYAQPENERWSPKVSGESFKPINPNNIVDDKKQATTERRSDKVAELDIITARNEYDDILISVTPASNNRNNKKIPEIPPTLEALVEQSKVTKSDSAESMSTFESMLEEVMKSLEEQDADEYTTNVMKHKGGEIGEIPPERIISSGDSYVQKTTTQTQEATTFEPTAAESTLTDEEENDPKSHRRGFWKRIKVRPVTTESIEAAESQYYTNTVNRLGQPVKASKFNHDKTEKSDMKVVVTTYKPNLQFIKDFFENYDETLSSADLVATVDIPKIKSNEDTSENNKEVKQTTAWIVDTPTTKSNQNPGDFDLGTGSPDPTIDDSYYTTTETIPTKPSNINRSDGFSLMDYLFGTSQEDIKSAENNNATTAKTIVEREITSESTTKFATTESTYMPDEIATENIDTTPETSDVKAIEDSNAKDDEKTEISIVKVETSSVSSFMNPSNVVSTSMSTQVSHETEICFRGKCIKTNKDIL